MTAPLIRVGLFRYVRHADIPAFQARGWLVIDMMADCHHGAWSALMWRCDCPEVEP